MQSSCLLRATGALVFGALAIAAPAIASPPKLIADFSNAPGPQWGSYPRGFVTSGQNVFFLASTPDHGRSFR